MKIYFYSVSVGKGARFRVLRLARLATRRLAIDVVPFGCEVDEVQIYFHSVLLTRASEISAVLICVVIALSIFGALFVALNDFVKILCLGYPL